MKYIRLNSVVIAECILNFLASRAVIMGMNPVAVALYVLACTSRRGTNPVQISILAGVISCAFTDGQALNPSEIVKYIMIFICISIIDNLTVRKRIYLSRWKMSCAAGALTVMIGMSGGILNLKKALVLSLSEGIIIVAIVCLLYKSVAIIHQGRYTGNLSSEQIISLVLYSVLVIRGIWEPFEGYFSLSKCLLYIMILYMSCMHGASAGAIAGVSAGIFLGAESANIAFAGMYCIVGALVGILKESGKWISICMFLVSGTGLALIYPEELWNIYELKPFLAAVAVFVCIPTEKILIKEWDEDEDVLIKYSYRNQTSERLREYSEAFERISRIYEKESMAEPIMTKPTRQNIFDGLAGVVCAGCSKCSTCWESEYYETYQETIDILDKSVYCDKVDANSIPPSFAARCIRLNEFMNEANHQLEIARITTGWINRFAENRGLIARQMSDISKLMKNLDAEVSCIHRMRNGHEKELVVMLTSFGLKIKKLGFMWRQGGRLELCIQMKCEKNACVTYKEVCNIISSVLDEKWCVADEYGSVVPGEYCTAYFVKDVRYRIISGVSRVAKENETVSGDSYSFITMPDGKAILTITDGMGSGQFACSESETVIELIENLITAGFGEELALRIVNSSMLYSDKGDGLVTVDIAVVDLNNGSLRCIKYGAAPTYIRNKEKLVAIEGDDMPLGLVPDIIPSEKMYRLTNGDYIIMMSDGITDNFAGEKGFERLEQLINDIDTENPQEIADRVLAEALKNNRNKANDDMSVLVAGLWRKN